MEVVVSVFLSVMVVVSAAAMVVFVIGSVALLFTGTDAAAGVPAAGSESPAPRRVEVVQLSIAPRVAPARLRRRSPLGTDHGLAA